jgi:glutamate 5-kinase
VVVDDGARRALCDHHRSLLPAGVRQVEGAFAADDAVEIVDAAGVPFATGLVRYPAAVLRRVAGCQTSELDEGLPHEVVHRDDLVVLPT